MRATRTKPRRAKSDPPTCWACSAPCPSGSRIDLAGWLKRTIVVRSMALVELYCDDCFRTWGWPALVPELPSDDE